MNKINIYGGPGSGTATLAALLYLELKLLGVLKTELKRDIEPPLLPAKDPAFSLENLILKINQENSLEQQCDYLIIDSPLILRAFYTYPSNPQLFHEAKRITPSSGREYHFLITTEHPLDGFVDFVQREVPGTIYIQGEPRDKVHQILSILGLL